MPFPHAEAEEEEININGPPGCWHLKERVPLMPHTSHEIMLCTAVPTNQPTNQ